MMRAVIKGENVRGKQTSGHFNFAGGVLTEGCFGW